MVVSLVGNGYRSTLSLNSWTMLVLVGCSRLFYKVDRGRTIDEDYYKESAWFHIEKFDLPIRPSLHHYNRKREIFHKLKVRGIAGKPYNQAQYQFSGTPPNQ